MFPSSSLTADIQHLTRSIATSERKLRLLQHLPSTRERQTKSLRIESNLAFQRFQLALVRYEMVRRKFNPSQLRVPSGDPHGGRWTSEGGTGAAGGIGTGSDPTASQDRANAAPMEQSWEPVESVRRPDGTLSRQIVINQDDKTAIRSEFSGPDDAVDWDERHTVRMPDGTFTTFETAGLSQTVFDTNHNVVSTAVWTADGPQPEATVQPAYYMPPPPHPGAAVIVGGVTAAMAAATALYNLMSSRNAGDAAPVFAFRADAYVPGADLERAAIWVGSLTKEQVDQACPRHGEVQSITNQAVEGLDREAYSSGATYGTGVHSSVEKVVNGPNPGYPKDPNFRAEASFIKSVAAARGRLGSRRIDVLENPGNGAVCVYDIKTGESGLLPGRAQELASTVQYLWPGTQKIIVTEVRPGR